MVEEITIPVRPIEAPTPLLVLSLPISPDILNMQLQAAAPELAGGTRTPVFRLCFVVPAETKVTVPILIPKGWICTKREPLSFESYYYHHNLTVDVAVDEVKINPFPMPFTGAFSIDFGRYYVKRKSVELTFSNATTTPVTVTFQVTAHLVREDIYLNWYEPIIRISQRYLDSLKTM